MWRSYATGLSILLIYLMTTFRFLAPVVHYQLDYTYISEVLCLNRDQPQLACKGKCQLRKNLKALQTDRAGKDQMLHLASAYDAVEDVPTQSLLLPALPAFANTANMLPYHFALKTWELPALFHPPQV